MCLQFTGLPSVADVKNEIMVRHGLPVKDQTVYFGGIKVLVIVLKKKFTQVVTKRLRAKYFPKTFKTFLKCIDISTCPFRYVNMHKFMRLRKNPSRIVDMLMEAANIQVCMQLLRVDFS